MVLITLQLLFGHGTAQVRRLCTNLHGVAVAACCACRVLNQLLVTIAVGGLPDFLYVASTAAFVLCSAAGKVGLKPARLA